MKELASRPLTYLVSLTCAQDSPHQSGMYSRSPANSGVAIPEEYLCTVRDIPPAVHRPETGALPRSLADGCTPSSLPLLDRLVHSTRCGELGGNPPSKRSR
jgi:hypothetical protein